MSEGVHPVMIKFEPHYHKELIKMSLRRSAELGRRVSMGFVLQELIEERLQLERTDGRSAELFRSRD